METLFILVFALVAIAVLAAFGVKKEELITFVNASVSPAKGKKSKSRIKDYKKQRQNRVVEHITDVRNMLAVTGNENKFAIVVLVSAALAAVGGFTALAFENVFLVPALVLAFGSVPFLFVQIKFIEYQKQITSQLSLALSGITTSYERNDNIVKAFEENLDVIDRPARAFFEEFVNTVRYINPDIQAALDQLKSQISNAVFVEWCEALKSCVNDRTLKSSLRGIVSKYTEIKIAGIKLDNILREAKSNFFLSLGASVAALYIGYQLLPNSFGVTLSGWWPNLALAISVSVMIFTAVKVLVELKQASHNS